MSPTTSTSSATGSCWARARPRKSLPPTTLISSSSSTRFRMARCASTSPGRPWPKTSGFRVLRDEPERDTVVAPALVGGRRAVIEDVAVVAAAALAVVLLPRVDQEEVLLGVEHARDGGEEARPAGARLVLHLGGEQRQPAAGAGVDPRPLLGVERARAG